MRRFLFALALLGLVATVPTPVQAATVQNKFTNNGLYLSPLRSYTTVDAGQTVTRSFRVANLTDKPMQVTTSIDAFSVADLTYELQFGQADNDWVQFTESNFTLKPLESRDVLYKIAVPAGSPAGGHYYTLYSSTNMGNDSLSGTVRAAHLLYVTVSGDLRRSAEIKNDSLFPIVLGPQIPYEFDIKNTGNIHYFAYFLASVDGLFYHSKPTGTSQLLMPGKTRHTENTVRSPTMPGIYKVTYGFNPDQGTPVRRDRYVLFLPPWFIIFALLAIAIGVKLFRRRKTIRS